MKKIFEIPKTTLNKRHGLSHQRIANILGKQHSEVNLAEKLNLIHKTSEFIKLTDSFSKNRIAFIPLKGPLLSFKLYKDSSFRYFGDLDFLILDNNDLEVSIQILEEQGYKPFNRKWPKDKKGQIRLRRTDNHILYLHPVKKVHIELHWKLFRHRIIEHNKGSKIIKDNTTAFKYNSRTFTTFSNEFELLYLIIHGGFHTWKRLKWLVDVKDYLETIPLDNLKFLSLVDQFKAQRMVYLCNQMLISYFSETKLIPHKSQGKNSFLVNYSKSQIESENYFNNSPYVLKLYWFKLNCFPGIKYKISILRKSYFTAIEKAL